MPTGGVEMRSMQKRVLYMLKKIYRVSPCDIVKEYIAALEVEMEEEDVALVEKKLK